MRAGFEVRVECEIAGAINARGIRSVHGRAVRRSGMRRD